MCGFVALFEKNRDFAPDLISQVGQDIFHRGPDSGGVYQETGLAMVFRRLSIMDVSSASDQPMHDENGRYVMVFNGEIYNYIEIRDELQSKGVQFKTTGDSEALFRGFIEWGPDVLKKLEGMFTFVIWDKQERKVYAARDPLGIKPLYMARKGPFIGFASEMRPLRRLVGTEVDEAALAEIIVIRYPTERHSNLKNIEMIPGGTLVTYDLDNNSKTEHVYEDIIDSFQEDHSMTYEDALRITEEQVVESVKRHLQSDVGYSVQLSGGVDSSLIAAIASEISSQKVATYGVKLEDQKHDESQYRQMVIDRYDIDHHEVLLTGKDFADGISDTCKSLESPTAHWGCVFLKRLCLEISKKNKVTLVGEGADEFFGGYDRYSKVWHTQRNAMLANIIPDFILRSVPQLQNVRRYKTLDPALLVQGHHDHNYAMQLFPDMAYSVATKERIQAISELRTRIMAADQLSYLGSLLLRQDKISMAHSVETRTPFVHIPMARALNKIPLKYRIPGDVTKPLLKKVAEKWLPNELLYRRKVGLTLPLYDWMKDEKSMKPLTMALTDPNCAIAQYADHKKLKAFVESFYEGKLTKPTHLKILPILLITNIWLEGMKKENI